ncbi:MAG TPA: trypsin-like peptidase domain-containing protein [Casimicrobiaceae bacterium]|nr:trypsin-like peptidase domain-containing protein [Casimicrobiaceae bacterium]
MEATAVKARNTSETVAATRVATRELAVGFGRVVPAPARAIALSELNWVTVRDGAIGSGRSARIEIRSPGAAAMRVALQLPATESDLTIRFAGSTAGARVFGPVPASAVSRDTKRFGEFWSPVVEGDVATIEVHAGPGVALDDLVLTLPRVSHHVVRVADLRASGGKTVTEIGMAQSCTIDVACVTPTAALSRAAKAVAQLLYVGDDGREFLCTGTLLSDVPATGTPYVFTAAHCMTSARAARTLNTFWFFDAIACRSNAVPPFVQLTAGAALLGRSQDHDWALVRLNEMPPAGAAYSAWTAEPIISGTITTTMHHPIGDLKKWTQGYVSRNVVNIDTNVHATFLEVAYTRGITEAGSSGAALLTPSDSGDYYEVRGGVSGGNFVTCPVAPSEEFDDYSRVEDMLPLVRQYLTPQSPNPKAQVVVVEFFNSALNHYFLTANAGEIGDLDAGVRAGWERTGLRFLAYARPVAGANPVCRFYRKPSYGDSHFYSASPQECAATTAGYPDEWISESAAAFYIQLPDAKSGACPDGTQPVWRFFNKVTVNHRYTAEQVIRDQMRARPSVWIPEGYGPDRTIMCAAVR